MKYDKGVDAILQNDLQRAVSVLVKGGIVAFPTETYYGLGVDPFNETALKKLFTLKERPMEKPVLVLIGQIDQLAQVTDHVPELYWPLIRQLWPGPLTLIFQAKEQVLPLITGNTGNIGVRMSPHPVAQQLCAQWRKPITATSANLSGMVPAQTRDEVIKAFSTQVDFIIDGGPTPGGLCSTIATHDRNEIVILREGQVSSSVISEALSMTRE